MVSASDIGWSKYQQYEGPFFRGVASFKLPPAPTEPDRIMRVITATEGGHYDAFNGYDSCDATLGLIQWCDRGQYSVCDMLGHTAEACGQSVLSPVREFCGAHGITFKKNARGRYRYFFPDERGEVDRAIEQDQLYHLNSSGKKGSWDRESRSYALQFAAAMANVYQVPAAQLAQVAFTAKRLEWFVGKVAKSLWDGSKDAEHGECFRAAFLSYAANNPTWAQKYLVIGDQAMMGLGVERYSVPWLARVLRELTFGPKVAIYPTRYNAIRPVLEQLYGVDLPDMAAELRQWSLENGPPMATEEAQAILVQLGHDLGSSGPNNDGVDNVFGKKTREAIRSFQERHGLEQTGFPDPATRDALFAARDALAVVDQELPTRDESDPIGPELRKRVQQMVAQSIADMARRAVADARASSLS